MESEIVSIRLPASLYAEIEALAKEEREEPVELIARLVETARQQYQAEPTTRAFRAILERATDLGVNDVAEQHDHYLYGVEKK
jgi:metal-responsive CopG/Arc/MetJ family transcriptional regulator